MKYAPQPAIWTPLIFGILIILWTILFFNGSLNASIFGLFEICSVGFFISSLPRNFIALELKDNMLTLKKYGLSTWQVPISDISMIDDTQNKHYVPDMATTLFLRRRSSFAIGFALKTVSNQVFVVPYPIQNYPNFLNDLQAINPNIQVTKLTEALTQPVMDKFNKRLW